MNDNSGLEREAISNRITQGKERSREYVERALNERFELLKLTDEEARCQAANRSRQYHACAINELVSLLKSLPTSEGKTIRRLTKLIGQMKANQRKL